MLTKEEYQKFCEKANSRPGYDGRGTYDLYECESHHDPRMYPGIPQSVIDSMPKGCGHKIITTYADKGVTPFTMKCPKCGARMTHTETYKSVPDGIKVLRWVRPSYEQYCNLSQYAREHVENCGLILEDDLK